MMRYCFILMFSLFMVKTSFCQSINWLDHKDLSQSIQKENNQDILLFFTADWCVYCKKMKAVTFKDSQVEAMIATNFRAYQIEVHTTSDIQLGQHVFKNLSASTYRQPIHDLALQLAQKTQDNFSLPFVVILDQDYHIKLRSFTYLSPQNMLDFLSASK